MRSIKKVFLVLAIVTVAMAQSPEPPLSESRLTVHTLVREDIFAGLLFNKMEQFSRGEKNINLLLEQRPSAKADLLAWKGSAALYRAVRAHEDNKNEEFERYYKQALENFSEAAKVDSHSGGVAAVTGGTFGFLADRLPEQYRAAAWSQAYDAYQALWKQQSAFVDKLPLHIRGELLAGLAQSAQRTGHTQEMEQYLDKIVTQMPDSPYASVANQWKSDPKSAATTSMTCMTCHKPGRLADRLAELNKQ